MSSTIDYTARALVFRFTDLIGPVSLPPFGTELVFDSREVLTVDIFTPSKIRVIETENALGVSIPDRVADRWRVTARTYTPDTYRKLFYLNDQAVRGNKVWASLDHALEYQTTTRTLIDQAISFQNAAIEWGEDSYRQLRQSRGYTKRLPVSFDVVRSALFIYPQSQGGGGGGGGGGGTLGTGGGNLGGN
jgi:hypothetical protein